MKRLFLSIFALCCIALSANAIKVYINPGHGSWGPNDRPNATIPYPNTSTGRPDTLGFYESNTNLWKCLYLRDKLVAAGQSVKMSRTKNGPYPYNGSNTTYNKALTTICSETNNYAPDHYISVHSNAATEGTNTNYPIILYRGSDSSEKISGSKSRATNAWKELVKIYTQNKFEYYTSYQTSTNVRGDNSFYGTSGNSGYLGALKHSYPGYLTEGYFHTYQPSRHRALNPDWCCQEGLRYYRGIVNSHGLTKDTKGYIMGEIKTKEASISNSLYKYNSNTTDKYKPIHGAKIILKNSKGEVIKTNCYPYVKRMKKNQNYYTTDNNYNGIFVFENLTPGTYTFSVHKSGYADAKGTLTVTANTTTYTTIYMTSGTGTNADDNLVTNPDVEWVLNGGIVLGGTVPTNDALKETFMDAYNKYFGQSIATTREFSNFLYYGNSIGCDVSKMMTDSKSGWKWLGDYISVVSKAAGMEISAEVNWRYSLTAFFTCGAAGTYNVDFTTAGKSAKWGEAYQIATGTSAKLPTSITSTYTIPTPVKEGYVFLGWYNTNNTSGTKYTTLSAGFKGKLYAIWELDDVDVKWQLNGGSVSVTLPTKIEVGAYTIPIPTRSMYVFLGWYDANSTGGNKLTSLPVGYKGTVYAIWREAKVTWVLNGGKVMQEQTTPSTTIPATVPTNDSLWTAFKPYYNTYYGLNRANQTIENVATFANAYMQDIMTNSKSEYKWLGTYIKGIATAQGYTLDSESAWRWHVHAFFNKNDGTVAGNQKIATANFSTAGKPSAWGSAYQAAYPGTTVEGKTEIVEVTLPATIKTAYTIPAPTKEGCVFQGWYDTNDTSGNQLITLPVGYDGTVYAIWNEEQTDVMWELNGGKVTEKLPTEITDSEYTIPAPTKEGYVFLGWYDNAEGAGDAITVLPVGYKGKLYALWREAVVTWELNGGKVLKEIVTTIPGKEVVVPEQEDLWSDFQAVAGLSLSTLEEIAAAGEGKVHTNQDDPCGCRIICAKLTADGVQAAFAKSEWTWLKTYIMTTQNAQVANGATELTDDLTAAAWRYAIAVFFLQTKHDSWPKTADFSTAGKPSAWGPAYQKAHGATESTTTTTYEEVALPSKITGSPYTIPTPTKEGDEFVGWYDNANGSGSALTVLPVGYDGTVYAIWKSGVVTELETVVRPALDMDAPMYDILGRRVDGTYRGIIIQNGNKYLLR